MSVHIQDQGDRTAAMASTKKNKSAATNKMADAAKKTAKTQTKKAAKKVVNNNIKNVKKDIREEKKAEKKYAHFSMKKSSLNIISIH